MFEFENFIEEMHVWIQNDQMFELKNGMFESTKRMLELNDRPDNTRKACLT